MPKPLRPPQNLDHIFQALAHKHRREIIISLSMQPYSIHQLAEMQDLSLPAIYKHIQILEKGGLLFRKKIGRTNFLALNRQGLVALQQWAAQFQTHWGSDLATLENYTRFLTTKPTTKEKKK